MNNQGDLLVASTDSNDILFVTPQSVKSEWKSC